MPTYGLDLDGAFRRAASVRDAACRFAVECLRLERVDEAWQAIPCRLAGDAEVWIVTIHGGHRVVFVEVLVSRDGDLRPSELKL